jgi:hypothetical protein
LKYGLATSVQRQAHRLRTEAAGGIKNGLVLSVGKFTAQIPPTLLRDHSLRHPFRAMPGDGGNEAMGFFNR